MVHLSTFVGAAALASSVVAAPAKYQYYQYEQTAPEELVEEEHVPVYQEKYAPHATTTVEEQEAEYYYKYETTALAAEETPVHEAVYEPVHEAVYEPIHEAVYEPVHDTTTLLEQEVEESTYEYVPEHTPEYIPKHAAETTVLPEEVHETTTWSSDYAYPTYGSGQSEWGAGYDDCVSQCVAKYSAPKEKYTPVVKPEEQKGNGVIHTVLVAPEKGVLRYFPFALNATVGDTVRYVWSTPANHTATLSSELSLCNRSSLAESRDFVSGIRNGVEGESTFDVVVQTEEPQFFYCSVQQHCEKGMWGVINPKSDFGGVNTVGSKWKEWTDANPDLKAAWSYVHETTRSNPVVDTWANSIDLTGIPEEAYEELATNIVWNRAMYDANPGTLENGKGAETPDGSPISLVEDLSILLSATNQDPAAVNQPAGTPTGILPEPSEVAEQLAADSGASKNMAGLSVATLLAVVSWMLL